MRVISGEAKGLALKWPKEPHIRPTADKVRGAIFSALEAMDTDWSYTLDLYAGTGAMGIEALSRGSEKADFVEKNAKCCAVIKENLERTSLASQAKIYRMEATKALQTLLKKQYSLVFVDPPYAEGVNAIMEKVAGSGLAGDEGTIIMEHSQKQSLADDYHGFKRIKFLHHGDTCVSIFQCEGGLN